MSRSFAARFPNTCGWCRNPIAAGQRVQYIDDDLVHVTCPPPPKTCPTCHLILPASGVCGECE